MKTERRTYHSYEDVTYAACVLKQGGLVVFPTETVYGLGALIDCPEAVRKIYEIKGRDSQKPLSILLSDAAQIDLVAEASDTVRKIAEAFWPGPLTLVLPKKETVPDHVTAGMPTVGIRIPGHAFALALIKEAGGPVVTTSANLSGSAAAVSGKEAGAVFEGKVDLIVDGGECEEKIASTVAGFDGDEIVIFREGIITKDQLSEIANR